MASKSLHLYSLSRRWACLHLNSYRQNYRSYITGVTNVFQNAFSSVSEPIDTPTDESPEVPSSVKFYGNCENSYKMKDDDFVPSSLSHWIENHMLRSQEVDIKSVVNNIVESDFDKISIILKNKSKSLDSVSKALDGCDVNLSEVLVKQILRRFSNEWIPAFGFFKWAESQNGFKHSPNLYNLMVDKLGKTRKFEMMWELVEQLKMMEGYVAFDTMSIIMRRFSKAGKYDDAIETFEKIELFGLNKDITAMNRLIDVLAKEGSVEHAERVYFKFKQDIHPTQQTYNMLVLGWCKLLRIDRAKNVVDEMRANGFSPDSATYTCLIEAYCREKDFRQVYATLGEMDRECIRPSVVTYTIVIKAFAKAKEIYNAVKFYELMKKNGCSPDALFYNVFISALSRAGMLKDADEVFDDMLRQGVNPGVSIYNMRISFAADNLQEEKALSLLMRMEENNCKPSNVTYAPLLKMCCKLKRMRVLSFLFSHMFKNGVCVDRGTCAILASHLCTSGDFVRICSFFEEMVVKGFVSMEILIKELEKNGRHEEKRRIEEVMMSRAGREGWGHSSTE